MIKVGKKIFRFLILFAFFLVIGRIPPSYAESGASLYLSPSTGTFDVGSTFNVSVFLNTGGQNINAVGVNIKFDPKKIQLVNPTAGKSFISIWIAQPSYSNMEGTIFFQGGIPTPGINTSSGLVSTLTFRALAPGDTAVYFINSSQVLLDDGNGTNILNFTGRGSYSVSIPPPEGPKVYSSTHNDLNKWRKNNNPIFSWEKDKGVTDFSYAIDLDSENTPDNASEGENTSVSYAGMKDGIWYFHIKAKKQGIWGGITNYIALIDTTPPAAFTPEILQGNITTETQPVVSFITTDSLSGIDHFEIKTIDITSDRTTKEDSFYIEAVSPYRLPAMKEGKYIVAVRAFDKAGNWRDKTANVEIVPEGFKFYKNGFWLEGTFIPYWLVLLISIILLIILSLILIYWWNRHKERDIERIRILKGKEKELKEHYERFN